MSDTKERSTFFKGFWSYFKYFLLWSVVVGFIALGLSLLPKNHLGQNVLLASISNHMVLWCAIRALIIIGFVLYWPYFVKKQAIDKGWPEAHTQQVIQRRWRYAVWLILISFVFHLS